MDILNSVWLLKMLDKMGSTPRERLLALFDILGDWLDAPHIRESMSGTDWNAIDMADPEPQSLLLYLTAQAQASGAQEPETLARQLYFMCMSMLREELRSPGCAASQHAKQVARALIQAQTQKEHFVTRRSAYAMAASVFFVTGILSVLAFGMLKPSIPGQNTAGAIASSQAATIGTKSTEARPEQTAALFAVIEQMRRGECQYPEALLLPDAQKAVYLTNVVQGQISTNAEDQQLVLQLLKKVRCNYTPMLMKNSVG
jgi:hypothetical protein